MALDDDNVSAKRSTNDVRRAALLTGNHTSRRSRSDPSPAGADLWTRLPPAYPVVVRSLWVYPLVAHRISSRVPAMTACAEVWRRRTYGTWPNMPAATARKLDARPCRRCFPLCRG